MNFKKLIPNPLDLGHKIIKDSEFELTDEQMKNDKVKGALRCKLIVQIGEVQKEVKAPTRDLLTAELIETLTAEQLAEYTMPELKTYSKDIIEGSASMNKDTLLLAIKPIQED